MGEDALETLLVTCLYPGATAVGPLFVSLSPRVANTRYTQKSIISISVA